MWQLNTHHAHCQQPFGEYYALGMVISNSFGTRYIPLPITLKPYSFPHIISDVEPRHFRPLTQSKMGPQSQSNHQNTWPRWPWGVLHTSNGVNRPYRVDSMAFKTKQGRYKVGGRKGLRSTRQYACVPTVLVPITLPHSSRDGTPMQHFRVVVEDIKGYTNIMIPMHAAF